MQKKFIEHDLPLAEISEESARENKSHHGHPSTLHMWWARRPLAPTRATTFAALLDDPGPENPAKREEIRELIKEITPWEAVKNGNSDAVLRAREMVLEQYGRPPKVLDPFAGGGSIPLEALRLGCETYASDYNPVAVFIEKATLEWPQKYGIEVELPRAFVEDGEGHDPEQLTHDEEDDTVTVNLLAFLVERWANRILEKAREEIRRFYPTETGAGLIGKRDVNPAQEGWTPVGYLWARTIPCQNPTCGAIIPLIKQFWLCKKKNTNNPDRNKFIAYRPMVDRESETVGFELLHGDELQTAREEGFDPNTGTVDNANAACLVCGQVTKAEQVRELGRQGQIGERMVVVVLQHPDEAGKKYRSATEADETGFAEATAYLEKTLDEWEYLEGPLPEAELPPPGTLGFRMNRYGIRRWKDIFNSRQQLALVTLVKTIKESQPELVAALERIIPTLDAVHDLDSENLGAVVIGYIGIVLNQTLLKNNTLSRWNNAGEKTEYLFSNNGIPMRWDYSEVNPFADTAGGWPSYWSYVFKALKTSLNGLQSAPLLAHVSQASATDLPQADSSLDAIFTDPPYYDNVPYAALSDFFYVWMKRTVGKRFPELFSTPVVPKSDEAIMEPARHDSPQSAEYFFERMVSSSFEEMHRVLRPRGTAVIVYAHKTTEGWETMLRALCGAGFVVTGSWPLHTESKNRLRAAQSAALASSIYMVCRKQERDPVGFWNDIQTRVKARVEEKLEQFWDAGLIRGGDFFISAIGPGMEHFSRYERVETYDGEEVSILDLLKYIRGVATDFLVHRLLSDASTESIDKEAQFYLTYRWTFRDNRVEYDDARKIASAEGVDLERLWGEGGFVKKTRKYIYVHGPEKRQNIDQLVEEVDGAHGQLTVFSEDGGRSNASMVDVMHCACRLWEEGRKEDLSRLLAESGYAQSGAFWQFCQATAECLDNGNKEKQLLEGLLMGKEQYGRPEALAEEQTAMGLEGAGEGT